MIIVCLEVECIIYEAQSLKQKRPTVKSIIDRIKNSFNVSIAETDFKNVCQRTKLVALIVKHLYHNRERVLHLLKFLIYETRLKERKQSNKSGNIHYKK